LLVKYEGKLGIGHNYVDVPYAMLTVVEDLMEKIYLDQSLERTVEDDRKFDLEMERGSESKAQSSFPSLSGISC
jgi:hypothetical protein